MKHLLFTLLCCLWIAMPTQAQRKSPMELGQIYTDGEFFDANGKTHHLKDYQKNKTVLLGFWSLSNKESVKDLKQMKKLYEQHADYLTFISINMDDVDTWKASDKQKEITWHNFSNGGNKKKGIAGDFAIKDLPTYIVITPEGEFQARLVSTALYVINWGAYGE